MSEDERTSPDLDDGPPNGSRLRAATVVVIGLGLFGLAWLGWQRLDEYEREWMSLRNRACVERDTALVRCLDNQAGRLAIQIDAWVRGDPSWATDDLDDVIPAPTRCLED